MAIQDRDIGVFVGKMLELQSRLAERQAALALSSPSPLSNTASPVPPVATPPAPAICAMCGWAGHGAKQCPLAGISAADMFRVGEEEWEELQLQCERLRPPSPEPPPPSLPTPTPPRPKASLGVEAPPSPAGYGTASPLPRTRSLPVVASPVRPMTFLPSEPSSPMQDRPPVSDYLDRTQNRTGMLQAEWEASAASRLRDPYECRCGFSCGTARAWSRHEARCDVAISVGYKSSCGLDLHEQRQPQSKKDEALPLCPSGADNGVETLKAMLYSKYGDLREEPDNTLLGSYVSLHGQQPEEPDVSQEATTTEEASPIAPRAGYIFSVLEISPAPRRRRPRAPRIHQRRRRGERWGRQSAFARCGGWQPGCGSDSAMLRLARQAYGEGPGRSRSGPISIRS